VALDRTRHQVWLPGTTTVRAYDFATHAPGTSVPVGSGNMGIIGVNPAVNGALVVLFPDSGNSAAQLIDMSPPAPAVAGSFGPAVSRYCGGGGGPGKSGDDVAVDPSHNRAFYLNSCSRMLEGYNLNVVFVK
jgi:hypothetical protein